MTRYRERPRLAVCSFLLGLSIAAGQSPATWFDELLVLCEYRASGRGLA